MSSGLLEELGAAVGPAHVVVDPEVKASYGLDWTGASRQAECRRPAWRHS